MLISLKLKFIFQNFIVHNGTIPQFNLLKTFLSGAYKAEYTMWTDKERETEFNFFVGFEYISLQH